MNSPTSSLRSLIFALEPELAAELASALGGSSTIVNHIEDLPAKPADVLFCPAKLPILHHLRASFPAQPVIVVSRHPEVGEWLDALESGASDYCAAPFDDLQLRWLLDTHVRPENRKIAAA